MHLKALLELWLGELELTTTMPINQLVDDSREVKAGDVFVALPGTQVDGQAFIDDAITNGAQAVLTEAQHEPQVTYTHKIPIIALPDLTQRLGHIASRFYGYPSRELRMIGITGTNGKTSVSHFIASSLTNLGKPCGIIGTLGWGFPGKLTANIHTTPQPITLQRQLAALKKQGAVAVAMEVSSHALDQGRHIGVEFDIAVFTNLSRDHLDYHHTMAAYKAAKFKLFQLSSIKTAVINLDDPVGREFAQKLTNLVPGSSVVKSNKASIIGYRMDKMTTLVPGSSVVILRDLQLAASGIKGHVETPWGEGELTSSLIGRFNGSNLLATIAVLGALDLPLADILSAIEMLVPVPGRLQPLRGNHGPLAVVDYAHTPDALKQVLSTLKEHAQGQLWCVFGCGGDRDRGKRPLMGRIAEGLSDHIIITNDNPRSESPKAIATEIQAGLSHPQAAHVQLDRKNAIIYALTQAQPEDIVLIAGKGHETTQTIGNETLHFNDAEVVDAYFTQQLKTS